LAVVGWQAIERTIERAVNESWSKSLRAVEESTAKVVLETNQKIGGLEGDLRHKIELLEKDVRTSIELLQNESRGRVFSGLGYMLGEMSTGPDPMRPQNIEKLEDALELCKNGYDLLKRVGGPAEFHGLNNLVFYSAVHGNVPDSDLLLPEARRLKEAGETHNAPNLVLTACRAILQYSSDPEEIMEARAALTYIAEKPGPEKQKKEAKLYLAFFDKQPDDASIKSGGAE
jgi:hypothetical protein